MASYRIKLTALPYLFSFLLGRRQAVSHQILDLAFVGSNPTAPANLYP